MTGEAFAVGKGSRNPTIVSSVERALSILDVFMEARQPVSVTEVSRSLGLNFSTTHHLVSTLCASRYLEQDPGSRKYRLGLKALELGLAAGESFTLLERARPVLGELAALVNETVNLVVRDGASVVYVDQAASSRTISMFTMLGARAPLYCTGVGKVFLAEMDAEEIKPLLEAGQAHQYTRNTLTSWDSMEPELRCIRADGYSVDREEREEGVACIAAPVRDHTGIVRAAISISGPAGRVMPKVSDLAREVRQAGSTLSESLGYRARPTGR
ncbi:MAG: IclR family transcriptional regulator [Bacillota bacterium]|nr:IclR family transcriptional regulator [Bacillota bacterium]